MQADFGVLQKLTTSNQWESDLETSTEEQIIAAIIEVHGDDSTPEIFEEHVQVQEQDNSSELIFHGNLVEMLLLQLSEDISILLTSLDSL